LGAKNIENRIEKGGGDIGGPKSGCLEPKRHMRSDKARTCNWINNKDIWGGEEAGHLPQNKKDETETKEG